MGLFKQMEIEIHEQRAEMDMMAARISELEQALEATGYLTRLVVNGFSEEHVDAMLVNHPMGNALARMDAAARALVPAIGSAEGYDRGWGLFGKEA